jgi:hypothetical protein
MSDEQLDREFDIGQALGELAPGSEPAEGDKGGRRGNRHAFGPVRGAGIASAPGLAFTAGPWGPSAALGPHGPDHGDSPLSSIDAGFPLSQARAFGRLAAAS